MTSFITPHSPLSLLSALSAESKTDASPGDVLHPISSEFAKDLLPRTLTLNGRQLQTGHYAPVSSEQQKALLEAALKTPAQVIADGNNWQYQTSFCAEDGCQQHLAVLLNADLRGNLFRLRVRQSDPYAEKSARRRVPGYAFSPTGKC